MVQAIVHEGSLGCVPTHQCIVHWSPAAIHGRQMVMRPLANLLRTLVAIFLLKSFGQIPVFCQLQTDKSCSSEHVYAHCFCRTLRLRSCRLSLQTTQLWLSSVRKRSYRSSPPYKTSTKFSKISLPWLSIRCVSFKLYLKSFFALHSEIWCSVRIWCLRIWYSDCFMIQDCLLSVKPGNLQQLAKSRKCREFLWQVRNLWVIGNCTVVTAAPVATTTRGSQRCETSKVMELNFCFFQESFPFGMPILSNTFGV